MLIDEGTRESELRDRAVKRIKKRRDFYGHLLIYSCQRQAKSDQVSATES
jgi:hypothetical protein